MQLILIKMPGNRQYKPCLYLYNKIDQVSCEEVDQLARMPHSMVGSVAQRFNIGEPMEDDLLKQNLWKYLGLTRIYTKRKGKSGDGNPSTGLFYAHLIFVPYILDTSNVAMF